MGKTQVNVLLDEARLAKVDAARQEIPGVRCGSERAKFVAFLLNSAIDALPDAGAPKIRVRSTPKTRCARGGCSACMEIDATGHADANGLAHTCIAERSSLNEGARLRAAREAAKLTQPQLATSVELSRNQVHRAERAASLEPWPALRSWLQAQEAKS